MPGESFHLGIAFGAGQLGRVMFHYYWISVQGGKRQGVTLLPGAKQQLLRSQGNWFIHCFQLALDQRLIGKFFTFNEQTNELHTSFIRRNFVAPLLVVDQRSGAGRSCPRCYP